MRSASRALNLRRALLEQLLVPLLAIQAHHAHLAVEAVLELPQREAPPARAARVPLQLGRRPPPLLLDRFVSQALQQRARVRLDQGRATHDEQAEAELRAAEEASNRALGSARDEVVHRLLAPRVCEGGAAVRGIR